MYEDIKKICLAFALSFLLLGMIFIPISSALEESDVDISKKLLDDRPKLFSNVTEDGIELEWNLTIKEDLKKVRIFRSLGSGFKSLYEEIEKTHSEYLDEDVDKGRTYHYWISAWFEDSKRTKLSNEVESTTEGENTPLPPRNLKAFPGDSKVVLRWDPPQDSGTPGFTQYKLFREEEGEESETQKFGNGLRGWEDNGLENGKEYTYRLQAENPQGKSGSTEKVKATPTADFPRPNTPTDFKVFFREDRVELIWKAPEDDENLLSYRIYKDGEELELEEDEIPRTTHYAVDDDVEEGETYNYSICSLNAEEEESERRESKTISVSEEKTIGSPENFRSESGDKKVKLAWDEPAGIEGNEIKYNIYRGDHEDDLNFLTQVEDKTSFEDKGLKNGRVYHYEIRAVDSDNRLGNTTESWHAVPVEQEEDTFSLWSVVGFFILIAIGLAAVLILLKQREPEGPNPDESKSKKEEDVEEQEESDTAE
ncbi:MAG: fibronectin type III domain-containing protein [Candidatus Thermoplasmatota archaeon]|nr:fibronectin type III domain-containing protein [Candidatus Thermoplasmatota archaeon]